MNKVLIIEDDELVRSSLREVLESHDFSVLEAENGDVGIEMYKANEVDIIVTDIVMPAKDGLQVIQELKLEYPLAKIIAISGGIIEYSNTANILLPIAENFGAEKILKKPYSNEELLEALRGVLEELPEDGQLEESSPT
jgi:YesN/AraC family two-component response regulator